MRNEWRLGKTILLSFFFLIMSDLLIMVLYASQSGQKKRSPFCTLICCHHIRLIG